MKYGSLASQTLLASAFFALSILGSGTVSAVPKAAEHADAPVTYGADAAKPKPAASGNKTNKASKTQASAKPKSAAKAKPAPGTPQAKKKAHPASGK